MIVRAFAINQNQKIERRPIVRIVQLYMYLRHLRGSLKVRR